jgi:ABC-2 type transport system ATP-binding protein
MIYDKLTPLEHLEFVAGLWSVEPGLAETRARELIRWLGLEAQAHDRGEGYSRGMRQKVALAGALVHEPKLIILDEQLTGLDVGNRGRSGRPLANSMLQYRQTQGVISNTAPQPFPLQ